MGEGIIPHSLIGTGYIAIIMNDKKILLYIQIVLLSVLVSCNNNKEQIPIAVEWECTESNLKDTFDIQSLFKDRYILALEETEKSRIGNIEKLVKVDSLLFVLDNRLAMRVFVFNATTGRFINSIGRTGKGPGEYVDINDFSVDSSNGTVSLMSERHEILVYDYQGNFIRKKGISFHADKMESKDGKYYFACFDEGRGSLIVTDKDMHVTHEYLENRRGEPVVLFWFPLQKMQDGTIAYFRYMDDTVYTLDKNDSLSIRYKVNFGEKGIDRELVNKDNMLEMEATHRCCIYMCTENELYTWIGFYDDNEEHESVLNRKTGKSFAYPTRNKIDSSLGICRYAIMYSMPGMMATIVNSEDIKEELVRNKDCNRGNNPGVYFLINK